MIVLADIDDELPIPVFLKYNLVSLKDNMLVCLEDAKDLII